MPYSPDEHSAAEGLVRLTTEPGASAHTPPPRIRDPSIGKEFYDPGEGREGFLASPAPTIAARPGGKRRKTLRRRRFTKKRRYTRRR